VLGLTPDGRPWPCVNQAEVLATWQALKHD
jgi:hypothetical protein